MAKHKYSKEEITQWRKQHGSFAYFNTDDTNFTVPKAYSFGFALNWAHPLSWLIGAAIIALLVCTLFFKSAVPVI